MNRNRKNLLLVAVVAAGLAVSGVSECVCPAEAACCGPACADGTHRNNRPVENDACCGGEHDACVVPAENGDKDGAEPGEDPCSCRTSRRDPVLRKTGPSSDYDGLSVPVLRTDTAPLALSGAAPAAPVQLPAARRALHLRLCVWTC